MRAATVSMVLGLVMLVGCTSGAHVAAAPTSATTPSSSVSPSPTAVRPPLRATRVSGVYVGRARLARTDVQGVSHRAQHIRWVMRPRCASGACAVRLVSKSGHYTVVLRRRGAHYVGVTSRPGFFTCAGRPERVRLRVVLRPVASAQVDGAWLVTRVVARLRNVSVPTRRCRRSFLDTAVAARRR